MDLIFLMHQVGSYHSPTY